MPFTLSHPAAILPFLSRSRTVSWKAALVVGAMTPDLWFLLPGLADRAITHGRFGLLVDPPAALLLTWISVRWILPRLSRLPGLEGLDHEERFRWGLAYVGSVIGVATHLVWDQFTHAGSHVLASPVFRTVIYRHPPVYMELGMGIWYLNSLVGAVVLVLWLHRRMRSSPEGHRIFFSRPWALVGLGFMVPLAVVLAWLGDESLSGPGGVRRAVQMGSQMRVAGFLGVSCAVVVAILSTRWNDSGRGNTMRKEEGE